MGRRGQIHLGSFGTEAFVLLLINRIHRLLGVVHERPRRHLLTILVEHRLLAGSFGNRGQVKVHAGRSGA